MSEQTPIVRHPERLAPLPLLTRDELDYLGHLVDVDIESIEAAYNEGVEREVLAATWSTANAMRTAIREAQHSLDRPGAPS